MAWNTPSTWLSGAVLTAAQLNAQLRDNMKAIGDPWTSYTPTWTTTGTAPTLGNGTWDAKYCLPGKLAHFAIVLTWGSTTNGGSGQWKISLPFTPRLSRATFWGELLDAGVAARPAAAVWDVTAGAALTINHQTDASQAQVTATAPFTWGNGDRLYIAGTCEVA